MFKNILVPTDGSELSLEAAKTAAGLAAALGAKLTALHVSPVWYPPYGAESASVASLADLENAFRKQCDARAAKAFAAIEKATSRSKVKWNIATAIGDNPWESIIDRAGKQRCDLIVMASHGRKGLKGLLLGSETVKVLTHSKTPVLVCR